MNAHRQFEKLIPLYLYDELDAEQISQLQIHIGDCEACAEQLAELRILHEHLNKKTVLKPTEPMLGHLRSQLRSRLREEQISALREPWWQRFTYYAHSPSLGFQLVGAAAMLLIGILSGRFIWVDSAPKPSPLPNVAASLSEVGDPQPFIENIDLIEYEPATGAVTIRYKSFNDVLLQGQVDDASVRKLLVHAIRTEDHPGRRLAAVKAFGSSSQSDQEVEKALVYALENDTVDGVRLKAAKVLQTMPISPEIKTAFIRVLLKDSNSALRMEAVEALSKLQDETDIMPIFQEAAKDDENEYIRLRASKELERRVNPQFGRERSRERR